MKPSRISMALLVMFLLFAPAMFAQSSDSSSQSVALVAAASTAEVPRLIKFSGTLLDEQGHAVLGPVGVTFALYAQQNAGATLWLETQNVKPDANGDYIVLLGANSAKGVPVELFTSGEARWLGVQPEGQIEQPRVLLVSVPYALKAGDAETLGGKPASAFALSGSLAGSAGNTSVSQTIVAPVAAAAAPTPGADSAIASASACAAITADGTALANQVAKFSGPCQIHQSLLSDNGTTVSVAGAFNHPAAAAASATLGQNSFSSNFTASSFSSSTHLPVNQNFRWQAEPTGNNTSSPSGKLNLLFASGTGTPAETGLSVSNKGVITFALGQTFPGTGSGTVTSVGLTAPAADFKVGGSPVTTSGTLNIAWKVPPDSNNTANAIVKRDGTGSFNVTSITASGAITVNNGSSLNPISVQAFAPNAAAISASSRGSGLTDGVLGSIFSSGRASSGVIGLDLNSNGVAGSYTTGVTGVTQNSFGVGVLGYGVLSGNAQNDIGQNRAGVWGDDSTGVGVVATSDTGSAAIAVNTSSTFSTLVVKNASTANAIAAVNTGTASPTVLAQNTTKDTSGSGFMFRAEAPNVIVNGITAACQINTRGDLGCSGDVVQTRSGNGLVKALIYFDPFQPFAQQIVRCYNSQLPEPAAITPPCGFTHAHLGLGDNQIVLGFAITDRFFQVTANNFDGGGDIADADLFNTTSVEVTTVQLKNGSFTDIPFFLTVF